MHESGSFDFYLFLIRFINIFWCCMPLDTMFSLFTKDSAQKQTENWALPSPSSLGCFCLQAQAAACNDQNFAISECPPPKPLGLLCPWLSTHGVRAEAVEGTSSRQNPGLGSCCLGRATVFTCYHSSKGTLSKLAERCSDSRFCRSKKCRGTMAWKEEAASLNSKHVQM